MPPENRRRRRVVGGPDMTHWSTEDRQAYAERQRRETPVAEMALSVRVINTLEDNNVIMACDLLRQTYASLMAMKNFGEKTLTEVKIAVRALGLVVPDGWRKPPKPKPPPRPRGSVRGIPGVWG